MMIVKIISPNTKNRGFKGLAEYVADKQKLHKEKVEYIDFENFASDNFEDNIKHALELQSLNNSTKDKNMHISVSFREDEKPTKEQLKNIEVELLKSIGMEHHQRITATHIDTNNYHVHIVVNRIDPYKYNRVDPAYSKLKLLKKSAELEEKYNLKRDNHIPNWQQQDTEKNINSRAVDIKSHTGKTNLTDWIRDNTLVDIKAVLSDKNTSLEQLHTTLAKYNLELKERGNGLVIKDKSRNLFCKASEIDRNLSKNNLAKLYGSLTAMDIDIKPTIQFGTPKNDYWDKYKSKMDLQYKTKKKQTDILRDEYNQGKSAIQTKWRQRIETLKSDKRMNKRIKKEAYQKIFENQRKELRELYENYTISKSHINKENRQITYKDYLISESLKGDDKALEILRKQKPPKPKEDENTIGSKIDHRLFVSSKPVITKLGFVVYKLDKQNDNSKIIDKGNHLKVSNASDEALLRALEMAKLKYGSTLDITGDNVFKTKVISLVQKHNININFKDKTMQEILRPAIQDKAKEKSQNNNQTKSGGIGL
ncbi:MAG: TraI/MobA(P) family conjugative relaxase [Bacteroidales bacterium]|nr:TraI/MobA(P) family conjugative relaxase [Bacteroidales bacterium]